MKRKIFVLLLFVIISIVSCQKDYPKDIPLWLKDKIKEIKKDLKNRQSTANSISIGEYKFGDEVIYYYLVHVGWHIETYYNYEGTVLCHISWLEGWSSHEEHLECDHFYTDELVFERHIYTADLGD